VVSIIIVALMSPEKIHSVVELSAMYPCFLLVQHYMLHDVIDGVVAVSCCRKKQYSFPFHQ
jgi:hypothetical protein